MRRRQLRLKDGANPLTAAPAPAASKVAEPALKRNHHIDAFFDTL
jgi:hypothetical protein